MRCLAFNPFISDINANELTCMPISSSMLVTAITVPPVARTSSAITGDLYLDIICLCICNSALPYSKPYFFVSNLPGNLPGFLANINGIPSSIDINVPIINPLASHPITQSGLFSIEFKAKENLGRTLSKDQGTSFIYYATPDETTSETRAIPSETVNQALEESADKEKESNSLGAYGRTKIVAKVLPSLS